MKERNKPATAEIKLQKNMNLLTAAPPSVSSENTTYRENTKFLQEQQERMFKKTLLASKRKQFNFKSF